MLKKSIFLCFACFLILIKANSQDILVTEDGEIKAIVLKITNTEITYKKWPNLDDLEYVINKDDVLMIKYQNGNKEILNPEEYAIRNNAVYFGFGGLTYFISLNYERKLFYSKKMNFLTLRVGGSFIPENFGTSKNIYVFSSALTYNLTIGRNKSFEFGGGGGYYVTNRNDPVNYVYFTPVIGFRSESSSSLLFKFYFSMLTIENSNVSKKPYETFNRFNYYPFVGIDLGIAF